MYKVKKSQSEALVLQVSVLGPIGYPPFSFRVQCCRQQLGGRERKLVERWPRACRELTNGDAARSKLHHLARRNFVAKLSFGPMRWGLTALLYMVSVIDLQDFCYSIVLISTNAPRRYALLLSYGVRDSPTEISY